MNSLRKLLSLLCVGSALFASPARAEQELQHIYQTYRNSVVTVASAGDLSAGFFYQSKRQIITSSWVARPWRDVEVTVLGGSRFAARVVAVDLKTELALIELERDVETAVPFELHQGDVQVADPLVMLQPTLVQGEPAAEPVWECFASFGTVGGVGETYVLASAPVLSDWETSSPGRGVPLVSPAGKVVGMATNAENGHLRAATAEQIGRIAKSTEQPGGVNAWTFVLRFGWEFFVVTHGQRHALHGPTLSLMGVGWDRLRIDLRFSALAFQMANPTPLVDRQRSMTLGELDVGYQWLVTPSDWPVPIYIHANVGAALSDLHVAERRIVLSNGQLDIEKREFERQLAIYPVAIVGLSLGRIIDLDFRAYLDVEEPTHSIFGLSLGLSL